MKRAPVQTAGPFSAVTASDEDRAVAMLVLAFGADPACRWAWPDPRQYFAGFPDFVRALGGRAFGHGSAHCLPGHLGAALWLPPGVHPDEDAIVDVIQRTVAEEQRDAMFAVAEQMDRFHPNEPHWYLPFIGVDPGHQRKGYGSELLRHTLAACDRGGVPAYLESTNPTNTRLYERHGFEAIGTIKVGTAPPIVPMVRVPR